MIPTTYRGRFAPSPTGPLHFGSLVAAAASYLDARSQRGEWLIRMEDLDAARERPGAADRILFDLERFGFTWDGPAVRQTPRAGIYREALERLRAAGLVYPCACSRKEIGEERYPGTCARGIPEGREARSWRLRTDSDPISFEDRVFGRQRQDISATVGDFVLFRADGMFAYQLAVVVDDAAQGITDVVRGADLLDSTPRQIFLQRLLGLPLPRYLHVPIATDPAGAKLSKSTDALALQLGHESGMLAAALRFLGHEPPQDHVPIPDLWRWAIAAWRPDRVPPRLAMPAGGDG